VGNGGNDVLAGGAGNDTYVFANGWGDDTVVEVAGGGSDTLDFTAVTTDLNAVVGSLTVTSAGNRVVHAGSAIETILGGAGNDTLAGADVANTWSLAGADAGTLNGALAFSSFENLVGGAASDAFVFADGASVSGTIAGGAGVDTLDYAAST